VRSGPWPAVIAVAPPQADGHADRRVPTAIHWDTVPPREVLRSRRHAVVERLRQLGRKRVPGETAVLLDGWHLVEDALAAPARLQLVVVAIDAAERPDGERLLARCEAAGVPVALATAPVLAAASPSATPSGVVAIASPPPWTLADTIGPAPALVLVAVEVQDPGNLGAIVRVADAAGATGVVAAGPGADPLGWKALRGAMGSAFRLPLVRVGHALEAIATLRAAGLAVLATAAHDAVAIDETDLRGPVATVLGNEGAGLPPEISAAADARVAIPMRAGVDSLNVATAAAVIAYEARRQRRRA
jgi:TrmH family RNA methyltransferase